MAAALLLVPTKALALDSVFGDDSDSDVSMTTSTPEVSEPRTPRQAPTPREETHSLGNAGLGVQDPGTLGLSIGGPNLGINQLFVDLLGAGFLPTLGGSYFLTDTAALRVALGLGLMLEPNTDFAFSLGASYRNYHRGMLGRVAPFYEPGGSFAWLDDVLLINAFFAYGAEYFFTDQLSLGGSMGFEFTMIDGTSVIRMMSARFALDLTVYW